VNNLDNEFDRLSRVDVQNNQLLLAGKTAHDIAQIAGQLPCYIYETQIIRQRVKQLKQLLPEKIQLHYAMKANPMPALVCLMAQLTQGLDVASHKELHTALNSGMAPNKISFAGPAKSELELTAAIMAGVVINVESQTELQRVQQIAQQQQKVAKVAIRVNPDFELKGSGMKMSGGAKPFGIDAELCPKIIRNLTSKYLDCVGLHIFSGSQNLSADSLMEAHAKTLELADNICQQAQFSPKQINIGGGFGIPYFPGEKALDAEKVCQNLHKLLNTLPKILQNCDIHMELGRYLVAEAGTYLCQVTDIKKSRGQTYLMTNGGMHHHLANSGNFGQVLRRNYPVLLANRVQGQTQQVEICGPLCTPLDILAAKIQLPPAKISDYIAVLQSGAYGASASPQAFLSQPQVKEILL